MTTETTSAEFFDEKYRGDEDPWKFATSAYEQERYATLSRAIEHQRYKRAFEPGCSIGVLTERLASICAEVIALDISCTAAARAAERCRACPHVKVLCAALTEEVYDGTFDLMVLSEIGYYFTPEQWSGMSARLTRKTRRGGTLIAVHWLGHSEDHLMSGDQVHDILLESEDLLLEHSERHHGFRLDRWRRT